jgi:hypothetical protein
MLSIMFWLIFGILLLRFDQQIARELCRFSILLANSMPHRRSTNHPLVMSEERLKNFVGFTRFEGYIFSILGIVVALATLVST